MVLRSTLLVAAVALTAAATAVTSPALARPTATSDGRAAMTTTTTAATPSGARPATSLATDVPLVIAHRGASGYRPEHTLASYELAARMGADVIEPDLVATKDHVLVARHENEISGTTDVASRDEFTDRRTTKVVDGVSQTGWFTEDFTLAELKTLRAVERIPQLRQENTLYDGLFEVPTFAEVLELRARLSTELRRPIGVYPETKHPTYFASIGLDLETPLVADLRTYRLDHRRAPVFVQSFELTNLERMDRELRLRVPLVFLTSASGAPYDLSSTGDPRTYADLTSAAGLQQISAFVDGVGPAKNQVIPRRGDGTLGEPTSLVTDAHAAGLVVHPYTFRAENAFLPPALRTGDDPADFGRALEELEAFLAAGVDGVFADQPDIAVLARDLHLRERAAS